MRMTSDIEKLEQELIREVTVRLHSRVMALVFGMAGGTGLFIATVWLVVRGGTDVGLHLGLLGNFFPGYSVTWPGAFVGFFYGALSGAIVGWCFSWVYNQVMERNRAS